MILLYDITWHVTVTPKNFTDWFIGHPTCSCPFSMFQRHPTPTRLFRLHAATQGDKAAIFCESNNDQARQLEDVSEHGEGTEWHGGTGSFVASRTVPSCGMVACHRTHVVAPMVGWCWMVCNTAGLDDFFRPQQSYAQCLEPESLANAPCNGSSINIISPLPKSTPSLSKMDKPKAQVRQKHRNGSHAWLFPPGHVFNFLSHWRCTLPQAWKACLKGICQACVQGTQGSISIGAIVTRPGKEHLRGQTLAR